MVVPTKFVESPESIQTTFDGADVATGIGYKRYFAVKGEVGERLTPLAVDATDQQRFIDFAVTAGGASALVDEANFDIDFIRTQIVDGLFFINVTHGILQSGGNDISSKLLIKVFHVNSGSTESQLGSTVTSTDQRPGAGVSEEYSVLADIDVPRQEFAPSEKLRISIEVWGNLNAGASSQAGMFADPTNRAVTANGDGDLTSQKTTLTVDVPYKQLI
jgi:hypothetical protein